MTYRELQTELKAYRSEGYSVPALNSKKGVLEAALNGIKAAIASQPVERVWKLEMMSLAKLRRYAKKAGFKHANQLKKQALIQALTA
jgi:hypothetical protein